MKDKLFIDGVWTPADGGDRIEVIDPATEQIIGSIEAASDRDVGRAVEAARGAFAGWSCTSGRERSAYLRAMAQAIEDDGERLAELEVRDNGKPRAEAAWDIADAAACFRLYADLAEELDGRQNEQIALPDDRFETRLRFEPVGVAAQIIPWNYPLLMAAWKVAPALAAGATCVLKPSEWTPLTALELAAIAQQVELPPGVLNIVPGYGAVAGKALAAHPHVDKIAFTGSVPTGRGVMMAAAQDIKNVSLELGGKSPIIVFDDADLEAAVEWVMFGIFWNQGQVCSATSRLILHERIADAFLERLVAAAEAIPIGPGIDPRSKLGPLVSNVQRDRVAGYVARARASGVRLLTGGAAPPDLDAGYFFAPTIFDQPDPDHELWREEIFGPVLGVRRFRTESAAILLANDTRFGLAAAIMTANEQRAPLIAAQLRAGIIWLNCSQPTFSEAPWGGMGQSGIGRELGRWGLDSYLEVKQVTRYTSQASWGWYRSA